MPAISFTLDDTNVRESRTALSAQDCLVRHLHTAPDAVAQQFGPPWPLSGAEYRVPLQCAEWLLIQQILRTAWMAFWSRWRWWDQASPLCLFQIHTFPLKLFLSLHQIVLSYGLRPLNLFSTCWDSNLILVGLDNFTWFCGSRQYCLIR